MSLRSAHFLAITFTALALVPAGAHLFEMPNKLDLPQDAYFTVQAIYRGWALFGIALAAALLANLAVALIARRRGHGSATALMVLVFAIFLAWTWPANQATANQATANWTAAPADWRELRLQWEYSHAANAVVTFLALCCAVLSALTTREQDACP